MLVFLGVMSNIASDVGYVVLIPIGAVIFKAYGRHPMAGLAAAFAGVSGGFSANLLIGTIDPMLAGISTEASHIVDPFYTVQATDNWFFMIASTVLIVAIGTLVTDKIVEPRLGRFEQEEGQADHRLTALTGQEAKGMKIASLVLLLLVAGLVAAAWLGLFRLPAPVQDRIDLLPDPHAVSGRLNAADSPVAPGSYRLVVNQIPTSQGPANVVNVEFENPAQNEYSARMDVYLDDTGELVGSTRMVAPGSYLEDLALAADLAPGTYRATAKVGVYSGATQVNTMSAALELRIEGWD